MDMEEFCDKFCPIPFRGTYRTGEREIDCDMEYNECPFKDVDFSKVIENTLGDHIGDPLILKEGD